MLLVQAEAQLPGAMRGKVPVFNRVSFLGEATAASMLTEGFRKVLCEIRSSWASKESVFKVRCASFKPPALQLPLGIALLLWSWWPAGC